MGDWLTPKEGDAGAADLEGSDWPPPEESAKARGEDIINSLSFHFDGRGDDEVVHW